MPTLILNQAHCRVALVSERLEIYGPPPDDSTTEQRLRTVPLLDVERVVAGEDTHFTPAALAAILRRQIPIQFFAWNGRFLGSFLPAQNHHGLSRLRQYQRTEDPAFVLPLAGRLVAAKIYNQRRVLQRLRGEEMRKRRLTSLTDQERRILELIGRGLTNRQIGEELHLAEKTVKNYVSNLLAKMGMSRRTEAAVYAARLAERRTY